ncbi:ribonuclease HII, partial [Aerococcus sp. UMB7533]|nr:ribonuclease HII [Aerococcus sp. UMB7533]
KASYVLVDAVTIPGISQPQEAIIKGDAQIYSIAAASIYAKEYRDQLMADYAARYPHYGFEQNAGYGTKAHLEALAEHG